MLPAFRFAIATMEVTCRVCDFVFWLHFDARTTTYRNMLLEHAFLDTISKTAESDYTISKVLPNYSNALDLPRLLVAKCIIGICVS